MSTPLASMFGSGFLVIVPVLASAVGPYAVWAMLAVAFVAFHVGAIVRHNILVAEGSDWFWWFGDDQASVWTFTRPLRSIQAGDRLAVRTNGPGRLEWATAAPARNRSGALIRAGGVMAGIHRYGISLGPFAAMDRWVELRFHCEHPGCTGEAPCCRPDPHRVSIVGST